MFSVPSCESVVGTWEPCEVQSFQPDEHSENELVACRADKYPEIFFPFIFQLSFNMKNTEVTAQREGGGLNPDVQLYTQTHAQAPDLIEIQYGHEP